MRHYKELLQSKLADAGWELVERDDDTDWWLEESWKIRSIRQKWGYALYILFLVDPMYDGANKSQAIWAISAVHDIPSERPIGENAVSTMDLVKGKFDQKLEAFVKDINKHRDEVGL